MRARRSVWADPQVQELLRSFVAVADEVGRLQRGDDAECRLFQSFCELGHYGGRTVPTDTRQGIYAIAPSGRFLASVNTTRPERMVEMLRAALARWDELPAAERAPTAAELERIAATARFEDTCPDDGLVLVQYVRDLGREVDAGDWRTQAWNEDQAWFTAAEARAFVPEPPTPDATVDVPARLVERLARLHLIDFVRGQTPSFPADAVQAAELRAAVTAVDGERVHLRLTGRTHTRQRGRWVIADGGDRVEHERGVRTALTGHATWHRGEARFEAFELLATGQRWGATQYNQRTRDQAPTRIGFLFRLAPAGHPRVAPAYWRQYRLR